MVILDNSTRWNLIFLSIRRALDVRKRINNFYYTYRADINKDRLTKADQVYLTEITKGLFLFYKVTKYLEGLAKFRYYSTIQEALPSLFILLSEIEKGLRETQVIRGTRSPLAVVYQNVQEKLKKYYSLTDNAHSIFAAAILLHPSLRKRYFDKYQLGNEAEQKDLMITNIKKTQEDEYKLYLPPLPP